MAVIIGDKVIGNNRLIVRGAVDPVELFDWLQKEFLNATPEELAQRAQAKRELGEELTRQIEEAERTGKPLPQIL